MYVLSTPNASIWDLSTKSYKIDDTEFMPSFTLCLVTAHWFHAIFPRTQNTSIALCTVKTLHKQTNTHEYGCVYIGVWRLSTLHAIATPHHAPIYPVCVESTLQLGYACLLETIVCCIVFR